MKRLLTAAALVAALAGIEAVGSQAAVQVRAGSGHAAVRRQPLRHKKPVQKKVVGTVHLASTPAGEILTSKTGHVLFVFTKDKRNQDVCKKSKNCEKDWPPVTTTVRPVAGPGVKKSLLGTIGYEGKLKEVTYKGRPLHTYKFDDGPSVSFTFIGIRQFGGDWYALTAAGKVVKNPGG